MSDEIDFRNGTRGAIDPLPAGKTRITMRLDDDVLEWFRQHVHAAGGGNYQTMMNSVLRDYVRRQHESLETTLRRVIREELQNVA